MEAKIKTFDQLTNKEVYEILKARFKVFVMEQETLYLDMDDVDYKSVHIFYEKDGEVEAYLRIFEDGPDTVRIGRVLTVEHGKGIGGALLREGIEEAKRRFHPSLLVLHAQCYAIGYYEKGGFHVCSEPFMEDGIMHVRMEADLR